LLAAHPASVQTAAFAVRFKNPASVIGSLGALKLETLKSPQLFKSFDKRVLIPNFEIQGVPGTQNMKLLVRPRKAIAGWTAAAAERKVFAAFAAARRRECDRAMLIGIPVLAPDNSEF
jgi:hypothetical protein